MDENKVDEVKTYTEQELNDILKQHGRKPAGRKKLPIEKRKNKPKTLREDGSYETHSLTDKRRQALERARTALYNKRQAKKQEAMKHDNKVSIHKTEATATEHHTAPTSHLQYQAPSHQPLESSTRPEPMYF